MALTVNSLVLAFILTLAAIKLTDLVTNREVWHNQPVRMVLEKVLLVICVGLFLANVGTNPMNLDAPQRFLLAGLLLIGACFIAYTVYRYELAEKGKLPPPSTVESRSQSEPTAISPSVSPSASVSPRPSASASQTPILSPSVIPSVQPAPIATPTATPKKKLSRSEVIDGLDSRASQGRTILWLGAYKAGTYPLDQLGEATQRWSSETEIWLKENVSRYYALQFSNTLRQGIKEYPEEIRMNQDSPEYGIRKHTVDVFYARVLKLEEILKQVEAETNSP